MTTIQMNAELFRRLSIIAEDEGLMTKLLRYARRLTTPKQDPTLMTKEEFFDKIDRAEKQPGKTFASVEELDKYIRAL